jgi:intracellular septation protein A
MVSVERLRSILIFLVSNFGPLLGFYVAHHFWGLKIAIGVSLFITLVEVARFKFKRQQIPRFLLFSSAIAVVFGILDLTLREAFFFKFEACLVNIIFALYFGASLLRGKPLVQEFAEQQGRIDQEDSEDKTYFFRCLTCLWCVYFVLKAIAYLWINLSSSVGHALLLRIFVGNISLAVMMFVSIGLARPIWRMLLRLKLMPSTRDNSL